MKLSLVIFVVEIMFSVNFDERTLIIMLKFAPSQVVHYKQYEHYKVRNE